MYYFFSDQNVEIIFSSKFCTKLKG